MLKNISFVGLLCAGILFLGGCSTSSDQPVNSDSETGASKSADLEENDIVATGTSMGEDVDAALPAVATDGVLNTVTSCNAIDEASTCIEYIGSVWSIEHAELNCSSESKFSTAPCPQPAKGGCRIGQGTSAEIVTWYYNQGGSPFTDEVTKYASMSCAALPGGQWIQ